MSIKYDRLVARIEEQIQEVKESEFIFSVGIFQIEDMNIIDIAFDDQVGAIIDILVDRGYSAVIGDTDESIISILECEPCDENIAKTLPVIEMID